MGSLILARFEGACGNWDLLGPVITGFYETAQEVFQKNSYQEIKLESGSKYSVFTMMLDTTKSIIQPLLLSQMFYNSGVSSENNFSRDSAESPGKNFISLSTMATENAQIVNYQRVHKIINFIEEFLKSSETPWTQAGNFITYMVEMNQAMLTRLNKNLKLPSKDCRIKILQPANNFYDEMIDLFILLRLEGLVII